MTRHTGPHIVAQNPDPEALTFTPDNPCVKYDECGNSAPGNNDICPSCLDEIRNNDR